MVLPRRSEHVHDVRVLLLDGVLVLVTAEHVA